MMILFIECRVIFFDISSEINVLLKLNIVVIINRLDKFFGCMFVMV